MLFLLDFFCQIEKIFVGVDNCVQSAPPEFCENMVFVGNVEKGNSGKMCAAIDLLNHQCLGTVGASDVVSITSHNTLFEAHGWKCSF